MTEEKTHEKLMGIYGSTKEQCGCETKRYLGGKVVVIGCRNHQNISKSYHQCSKCGMKMSKKELKNHKWTHTVDRKQ